jgi:hypothetical protein
VLADRPRVDLLHMDTGQRSATLMETLDLLRGKVVVGTHSRQIEGRFFEMLFGEGWKLEIERPAILNLIGSVGDSPGLA